MKICSFYIFAFYLVACRRKKILSFRFSILGGRFGNERKKFVLRMILYEVCFSPLRRMQMISKRSSGIRLVEEPSYYIRFLKFQNPPLKFACDIYVRHLHHIHFWQLCLTIFPTTRADLIYWVYSRNVPKSKCPQLKNRCCCCISISAFRTEIKNWSDFNKLPRRALLRD